MYDTEVGRQVRTSFQALAKRPDQFTESDATQLRERVRAAVDEVSARDWPIERIIARVKELATETGLRLGYSPYSAIDHPAVSKVVTWCIERYYERQ